MDNNKFVKIIIGLIAVMLLVGTVAGVIMFVFYNKNKQQIKEKNTLSKVKKEILEDNVDTGIKKANEKNNNQKNKNNIDLGITIEKKDKQIAELDMQISVLNEAINTLNDKIKGLEANSKEIKDIKRQREMLESEKKKINSQTSVGEKEAGKSKYNYNTPMLIKVSSSSSEKKEEAVSSKNKKFNKNARIYVGDILEAVINMTVIVKGGEVLPLSGIVTKEFRSKTGFVIPVGTKFIGEAKANYNLFKIEGNFDYMIFPSGDGYEINATLMSRNGGLGAVDKIIDKKGKNLVGTLLFQGLTGYSKGLEEKYKSLQETEYGVTTYTKPENASKEATQKSLTEMSQEMANTLKKKYENEQAVMILNMKTPILIYFKESLL